MKKIYLLLFAMFIGFGGFTQTVLFEDDMESYAVGDFLAVENPTWYETWSNNPGSGEDAMVTDDYASTGTKSALCDETNGATDLILKLGNKQVGQYELSWNMYIESGFAGYYNIQHYEAPGTEWAFNLYFDGDGSILMDVCVAAGATGTYPQGVWFEVKHVIDIDADNCQLYIDGTLFHEWEFSCTAFSTGGTNQLGGVDFFAGVQTGSTYEPKFYFDDIYFEQTGGGGDPEITVTPDELNNWVIAGGTTSDVLTVENTGGSDLNWDLSIIYDIDAIENTPVTPGPTFTQSTKNPVVGATLDPNPVPGGGSSTEATGILHYDDDNSSAIGWTSAPITVTVAARFPSAMTIPYAGLEIISVDVYLNDENSSGGNEKTLKIYGMGNTIEPGVLLHEQAFTGPPTSWTTVTLTTPVMVTGEDLWVGYEFTQEDLDIFIPGTDDGTNYNPNGDFLSTGVGWSHLGSNPSLMYNWNIRANLEGDLFPLWLSATPESGFLPPLGSEPVDVEYDATELDAGIYNATIRFLSNDPVTPALDVPVELVVAGVGIDDVEKTTVMIYPNPAQDYITIKSNHTISSVQITDFSGKVLYKGTGTTLNIRNLSRGVYFIRTMTDKGISNTKFVKK